MASMALLCKHQLHLMRSGVPNDELLKAKTVEDCLAIASRHSITTPAPDGIISGQAGGDSVRNANGVAGSTSQSMMASSSQSLTKQSLNNDYEVRRFTAPPSAFEGGLSSSALTQARIRRAQRAVERAAGLPTGTGTNDSGAAAAS